MKRLLSSAALFLCSLLTFAQYSGTGAGTESNPYLIFNQTQLSQMANFQNQDGVVFRLMKDLDLTDWINENNPQQGWIPIGVESSPFKGKLLGNNKTISGLSITRTSSSYVGFFGYLDGATIENLTIKGSSIKGAQYVGVLTGCADNSTFTNVNIEMTGSVTGTNYVGGFSGNVKNSTITNLTATVTGGVSGSSYVGGLIGPVESTSITTFSINANVSGSTEVGGAFSSGYSMPVTDGTIIGSVTSSGSGSKVGGVFSNANGCNLTDITMKGNVTSTGTGVWVGGIMAYGAGTLTLTNVAHVGDVNGNGEVSGCVAELGSGSSATFTSCSSKGKITNAGNYTGGIVAVSNDFSIAGMNGCSHFGDISGQNYVGGILGASVATSGSSPTLHTYQVYFSNDQSNTNEYGGGTYYTLTDSITDNSSTPLITNCTAIGNIQGKNWVGGLIGSDVSKIVYKKVEKFTMMGNTSYRYNFLWKDGSYTREYKSGYNKVKVYYYVYTREHSSHNLTNNYFSGSIKGTDHVGGIAGLKTSGEISCNYAYANISGASNVGGIIGRVSKESPFYVTLKSNVAICSYLSASGNGIGRIYGSLEDAASVTIGAVGSTDGNRALTQCKIIRQGVAQTIEDNLQNGTSIGPSLLRLKATYVSMGWDFDNNWKNQETESYPYKKYQAAPPIIESDLVSQSTSISGKSVDGGTVYLFYKDHEAVSTDCVSNQWSITTEPLQSGAQVQIYADVAGLTPSYFTSANVGYPGSGTEDDPYRIYTAEDLQGAYNMGYYKVMNDIDLTAWIAENSPVKGWLPVGLNSGDATYIDGGGHKITGLWINTTENYTGLFSNYSAGEIKNLTVEVASGKSVKGGDYTGILIGRMANGSIVNCQVKGDVIGTSRVGGVSGNTNKTTLSALSFEGTVSGTNNVGGIVGYAFTCPATNCNAIGTVNATAEQAKIGGLMGYYANSTISKSITNVTVYASGKTSYVGGLVGYLISSDVQQSLSKGSVTSTGTGGPTGGLVGYAPDCDISECYSSANTNGTNYTAGLVGYASEGTITNCYSTGNAIGTEYTAGLVAYAKNCSIDKCYAKGDVTGEQYGAGVVGELDGQDAQLTNSVAANNIISLSAQSSWGSRVIGGYKNDAADPEESNYALATMQVSLNNVPQRKTDDLVEGIAKSETELMTAATYQVLGWDFTSLWGIEEDQDYPYLLWEDEMNHEKVEQTLSINELPTMTYGDAAYQLPTYTEEGLPLIWTSSNTSIATISGNVLTIKKVGEIFISCSQEGNGDYLPFSKSFPLAINKANLHIIANSHTVIQGDEIPELTVQYEGFKYNDDVTCLTTQPSVTTTATSTSAIGNYPIIVSGAKAVNYDISYVDGTLSVVDAATYNNTLYSGTVEIRKGGNASISLELNNEDPIIMVEFFMQLPEGISVSLDEDGYWDATLNSNRSNRHSIEVEKNNDGLYHFLVYSSRNNSFKLNEGELINIKVLCDENLEGGTYQAMLRNILLNDANKNEIVLPDYNFSMHVTDVLLGDVNGDWKINGSDIVEMVDYIMGRESDKFIAAAAELTGDGLINGSDLVEEISLVMSQGILQTPAHASTHAPMLLASGLALNTNQNGEVVLNVGPDKDYILTQMTLHMSEGQYLTSITTDSRHSVEYRQLSESTYLVLCYSSNNSAFCSNEELLCFHYTGEGDITVKDVMMVGTDRQETYFSPVSLSETTGVECVGHMIDQPTDVYSISGYMVRHQATTLKGLAKGVYLINGKKIIIK